MLRLVTETVGERPLELFIIAKTGSYRARIEERPDAVPLVSAALHEFYELTGEWVDTHCHYGHTLRALVPYVCCGKRRVMAAGVATLPPGVDLIVPVGLFERCRRG